jgi:hypothetical protein
MNERIRELAEQAEQYADDTVNSDPARYDKPGQVKVWRELMQAKFAELIVRECAEVIIETRWHLPPTQQQIAVGIKEHFGVNE